MKNISHEITKSRPIIKEGGIAVPVSWSNYILRNMLIIHAYGKN